MTDSTTDSTSPKSIASTNSGFSRSRGTNSIWNVGLMWICTEEFEVCDLVGFGGVLFSVECVTARMCRGHRLVQMWHKCVVWLLFAHHIIYKCVLWVLCAHVRNVLRATHIANVLCDTQICRVIVLCTHKCVMWLFCAQVCANSTQMCCVVVVCTHTNGWCVQHTATYCNTLQHAATHCNTRMADVCNTHDECVTWSCDYVSWIHPIKRWTDCINKHNQPYVLTNITIHMFPIDPISTKLLRKLPQRLQEEKGGGGIPSRSPAKTDESVGVVQKSKDRKLLRSSTPLSDGSRSVCERLRVCVFICVDIIMYVCLFVLTSSCMCVREEESERVKEREGEREGGQNMHIHL